MRANAGCLLSRPRQNKLVRLSRGIATRMSAPLSSLNKTLAIRILQLSFAVICLGLFLVTAHSQHADVKSSLTQLFNTISDVGRRYSGHAHQSLVRCAPSNFVSAFNIISFTVCARFVCVCARACALRFRCMLTLMVHRACRVIIPRNWRS